MDHKKILKTNQKYILAFVAILFISFTRLLPHPPNFSPVTAVALFSGSTLGGLFAFAVPLLIMFISDVFLGLHATIPFVYISFLIITFFGFFLKTKNGLRHYVVASFASSLLFFVITNFGVWITSSMYQKNINGLILCYTMGVPFIQNTIVGDMIYTIGIFYGYKLFVKILQQFKLSVLVK